MSTNKKLEALSAQPSPGGQGDLKSRFTEWVKANSYNPATFASGRFIGDGVQIAWEAVQALAARKPVGEPVGQVRTRADGGFIAELFPGVADRVSNLAPLYAAPPAQAVDLGPLKALYRAYVRLLESGRDRIRDLGGACDPVDVMEANDVDLQAARRVIDSQAVGK